MTAPPPLTSIGPYRIQAELGRGGMGVVYLAMDPAIGRQVAVKVIRGDPFADAAEMAELRHRLAREAAAAGRLNHPGIVTVYQLGEHGDVIYIAMEFLEGTSLDQLMKSGSLKGAGEAMRVLEQVADALDYAHAMGVVHRDVKPANILVRPDGKAKITDFGIAKIRAQNVTASGAVMGTPEYMAPEQVLAMRVDGKADQFSLAVTAFYLLSGRKPFEAETANALMIQITQAEPLLLHQVNPRVSVAASQVIRRALAKSPLDRFASCREFVAALGAALAADPTLVREQPTLVAGGRRKSRKVAYGIAASAVVVCAVAAGWLFWPREQPAPQKTQVAAEPPPPPSAPPPAPAVKPDPPKSIVNSKDGLTYLRVAGSGPPFYLSQTETTGEAFARFNPRRPFRGKAPAAGVTWNEARAYCEWAGGRLPTEAEWDFAARSALAGPATQSLSEVAWFSGNSGGVVHEVGGKVPNAFGLHDMEGNVWEWVADGKRGPGGLERVLCGGSALSGRQNTGAAARWSLDPTLKDSMIGFRCAFDGPPSGAEGDSNPRQ